MYIYIYIYITAEAYVNELEAKIVVLEGLLCSQNSTIAMVTGELDGWKAWFGNNERLSAPGWDS